MLPLFSESDVVRGRNVKKQIVFNCFNIIITMVRGLTHGQCPICWGTLFMVPQRNIVFSRNRLWNTLTFGVFSVRVRLKIVESQAKYFSVMDELRT